MKNILTYLVLCSNIHISIAQCEVKSKWKCGNDDRLNGSNNLYQFVDDQDKKMCDRCLYDRVPQLASWPDSYPADWQTIFTDDFNAISLDQNYWHLMFPWGNFNTPEVFATSICEASLNSLNGGKLIQKGVHSPGTYNYTNPNGNVVSFNGSTTKYAETKVANVGTTFSIPINCRVRGNIKIIGDCVNNWPAFWLRGAAKEIDIFEIVEANTNNADDNYPCNYLKMSYGNTIYGTPYVENVNDIFAFHAQYGSDASTFDFSQGFHTYELIWDQFKIQFWLDGQIVYDDFVYFRIKNSWSNYHETRHWRESPIRKPSDLDPLKPHYVNKYALDALDYSMKAIIGFAAPYANSDYTVNQMETEWFSLGLRSDCSSGVNTITNLSWYNDETYDGTAYETGYQITTDPNVNLSIPNFKKAFFSATNEIALNAGISIESGAIFSAQLTACETGWDARSSSGVNFTEPSEEDLFADTTAADRHTKINPDVLQINDEDSIIYFNTQPEFDEANPFTELRYYGDHLTLSAENELINSAEIYDMRGELIYVNANINAEFISIQKQPNWATGLYIIRVFGSNKLHIHRVWIRSNY